MQRRQFIQTSAAAACGLAAAPQSIAAPANAPERELYEWRTYRLKDKSQQKPIHQYLESVVIPNCEELSEGPVGVFTEIGPEATPSIHALFVYPSATSMVLHNKLLSLNPDFKKIATEYLDAKKEAPRFERIDSWFMLPFSGSPRINVPERKERVLELRTYESFSEERARAKVEMFNGGEIEIFPKCGFENVFFGEAVSGSGLPCLKYMLSSPDMATNEKGWKTFLEHPDFVKMKDDPKYADTVSKITKLFLEPTDYSQV